MKMKSWRPVALLLWIVTMASMGGCAKTLFSNSDSYTRSRLDRYYDGDSAAQTSEQRRQNQQMGYGFGYPAGMANQ